MHAHSNFTKLKINLCIFRLVNKKIKRVSQSIDFIESNLCQEQKTPNLIQFTGYRTES